MNTSSVQDLSPTGSARQRWALGALLAAASASVVLSLNAWAGSAPSADARPAPPPGMMAPGGMGMPFGGRHLERLLDEAKVSDAQRTQIHQIMDKAQADLKGLHDEGKTLHEQGLKLWTAPKLDAAAIENLRVQMQAHHDKVSKRLVQAMLEVGNVLTPEQRVTIGQQLERHREDMMRHMNMRGRHPGGREAGPDRATSERQPEAR